MPRGDKTGPMGNGAMTGRGAGLCAGNNNPGFMNQSFGRGNGRGCGVGRRQGGGRNRNQNFVGRFAGTSPRNFNSQAPVEEIVTSSQQEELNSLKEQAQSLQEALQNIERRVNNIQNKIENKDSMSKDSEE